jgi:hypothetical protein
MQPDHQIRADFDRETIVVYQAYSDQIADPALRDGRFVEPFSFNRMTWIKPSFLWLMHRSNWAQKSGQERILAIRIRRAGWDSALAKGVLTAFDPRAHRSKDEWADAFASAQVHVQWDPERNIRGAALQHGSIQVGISRDLIREYNENWITQIKDITPTVAKMRSLIRGGDVKAATRHLPPEKAYPNPNGTARHLLL